MDMICDTNMYISMYIYMLVYDIILVCGIYRIAIETIETLGKLRGDLPEKKIHLTANLGRESPQLCPNKFWSRIC